MENFFHEEMFCSDLTDLMANYDIEEEDVKDLDEDWSVVVEESNLEKLLSFTKEEIVNLILNYTERWDDRFPEDCDRTVKQLQEALKTGIDVEKINESMPSLYYPNGIKTTITKKDLLEYI